jgi:hypothetical protein
MSAALQRIGMGHKELSAFNTGQIALQNINTDKSSGNNLKDTKRSFPDYRVLDF